MQNASEFQKSPVKYYLASALANKEEVRKLSALLDDAGMICTYKWWELHGEVGMDRYEEIAVNELQGVFASDLFILACPGKFGAHTELGAAMANPNRYVYIVGDREHMVKHPDGRYPSIFYYHPRVSRIMETDPIEIFKKLVEGLIDAGL